MNKLLETLEIAPMDQNGDSHEEFMQRVQGIHNKIGSLFDELEEMSDPAPCLSHLHYMAKMVLMRPVNGRQYSFPEFPSQPPNARDKVVVGTGEEDDKDIEHAKAFLDFFASRASDSN